MIIDFFSYEFLQRALLVGLAVGAVAALLGNFVVASRNAIISEMLGHAALAGAGLGIFWQVSPPLVAGIVAVISAVLLWLLRRHGDLPPEAAPMLIMTGSLALALLFAHFAKDNPIALETYLFGSILTIRPAEVQTTLVVILLVSLLVLFSWNRLRTTVIDPEYAHSRFADASLYEILFMLCVGGFVAVSLKVIGGFLIGALLVIPVLIARRLAGSFAQAVWWSIAANLLCIALGLFLSYAFDVPSSSAIVLSLVGMFVLSTLIGRLRYARR